MARFPSIITFAALACITLGGIGPVQAASGALTGIEIEMNQAKIVKLARPADTVVVGEPRIADITVQDSTTVILTGKGFGVTNLVILDDQGEPIIDEQVFVRRNSENSVRIYRRANVQTLSCSPFCELEFKNEAVEASDAAVGAN